MSNDEGETPRRRSLIPGASDEVPVTHDAENAQVADEPTDARDQPTEVYPAFAATEQAPLPHLYRKPVQALPWFRRTWVIATAAGIIVLGAVIGVILALTGGGTAGAAPTVSPSPTGTSPSPSASAEPAVPTLLDDGIAADEYPPAAPSAGPGYPNALIMKDWVWDHVGPTWTLVSVSNYDPTARTAGPSVIYLASPEGVLFDLAHVNKPGSVIQVVSWLTGERKARIQITSMSYTQPDTHGALVDLQTGAVDDIAFTMATGQSATETFLAASAAGGELWSAVDENYSERRYERWTAAGGWQRALTDADVSPWTAIANHDGSVVAAELYSTGDSGYASARSGPPGEPVLVVYDVASGSQTLVRPSYGPSGDRYCNLTAVSDAGDPIVACWEGASQQTQWATAVDGKPLVELSQESLRTLQMSSALYDVTTAAFPAQGISVVSAVKDPQVYEVSVDSGGSPVAVLKVGSGIPYGGLSQFYAARVAEGVTLVRANEACAIIDTVNAHAVTFASATSGIVGCIGYGGGNGNPPSYPFGGGEGG
ncbi:hypothetical protein [Demequina lutea]|uniref:Uncharacterized protein n=1 Tax=Demequina lutea TaxID=431489 RepID=A0A7Y9Z7J6_9MICO|nr:hypothetical protein [Demequina lutea]NYI40071.1 hypothetical protein [Demequina lutea]